MDNYKDYIKYKDICYKCSNYKLKDLKDIIIYLLSKKNNIEDMSNTIISYRYGFEKLIDKNIIKDFYNIIYSFNNLCTNLNITNTLDICILYTYLLWNGYFSYNHEFIYGDNLLDNYNTHALNIINGVGTCLSISDLLSYILTSLNIKNAILINKLNNNYHAYNLILDTNSFIFDSTNELIFKIEGLNKSTATNYTSNINIERSYSFINNKTGLHTIDEFVKNINTIKNISTLEINSSYNRLMEIIKNNSFDYFHMTIQQNLINIKKELNLKAPYRH